MEHVPQERSDADAAFIVVLPFENMGGDKEQEYFADGTTDDLTTDLSHVRDRFVLARAAAFTFKGSRSTPRGSGVSLAGATCSRAAGAAGEKVEVNAQLVSAESGAHVWADRFGDERSKLGELQVDVASRLANSLGVELGKAEALRSMRELPNNPDAVDLAMPARARSNSSSDNKPINRDVIDLGERALALDPQNERVDKVADSALAFEPDDAWAREG